MSSNTLFFWAPKSHGSTLLLSKGTEQHFLSSSGNAEIIIGLHLIVSRGSFSLGIAFGWIIIADLCGEQTGLNFGKTVIQFVSRDSSSLGSAFGWIILADLISGDQTGSNFGKTVPSLNWFVGYDNQVTKLGQNAKQSFCLLRFEINGTSAEEHLENFTMFSVQRLLHTSAPWSWTETCQTVPSKSESGLPEDSRFNRPQQEAVFNITKLTFKNNQQQFL